MKTLDSQTLEALADVICGDEGPLYRKGWELPGFFQRAGLPCPNHDGSTRKWWTLARLQEYGLKPANIESVIKRLVNPREYQGDAAKTGEALARVNQILSIEGLRVSLDGIEPRVSDTAPSLTKRPVRSEVPDTPPDFQRLTGDSSLASILGERWEDAQRCVDARAFVPAIVMMGSLLEGLLLAIVHKEPRRANQATCSPKDSSGKPRPFGDWHLSGLIDVAHECGWIQRDVKDFSQSLREYRNIVHPWQQRSLGVQPDEDTCTICWEVVRAAVNDLTLGI